VDAYVWIEAISKIPEMTARKFGDLLARVSALAAGRRVRHRADISDSAVWTGQTTMNATPTRQREQVKVGDGRRGCAR